MSVDPITCHILDTNKGKPASGVICQLFYIATDADGIRELNETSPFAMSKTDNDGRIKKWVFDPKLDENTKSFVGISNDSWSTLKSGIYKIKFLTGKYFSDQDSSTFFPYVDITFIIDNPPDNHYHIPLLLSNHGYTTYRGS